MSYYGYHQRIKQRIENGEMTGFQFVDDYPRIGPALVLMFRTNPIIRPIRPYRWPEYAEILKEYGGERMKKQIVLAGRYALLMFIAMAVCVGAIVSATMPRDISRAGGVIGAGWWAVRYIAWRCFR